MSILTLTNELSRHRDEMLKTIQNTITEWGLLYGGEMHGLLKTLNESVKKNTENLIKNKVNPLEHPTEEELIKLLIEIDAHQKNNICPWATNLTVKDIEHYMLPLQGEDHYQRFLAMVQLQNEERFVFPDDLFFLCGSHRFYFDLHKHDILNLEEYLPLMLKIDREVANIRLDISLSLATQKHRISESWRVMSRKIKYHFEPIERKKEYSSEKMQAALKKPKAKEKFSQFLNALAVEIGTTAKIVKDDLEKWWGYRKENFDDLKARIEKPDWPPRTPERPPITPSPKNATTTAK